MHRFAFASAHGGLHQREQLGAERIVRLSAQVVAQLHREVVRAEIRGSEDLAHEPFAAITIHGPGGGFLAGDDAESRMRFRVRNSPHDEIPASNATARAQYVLELEPLAKYGGCSPACPLWVLLCRQTASRARPFARRALMTARPALVFMRTRKPWVRLRRVFEG